jgi:hypothetical protein
MKVDQILWDEQQGSEPYEISGSALLCTWRLNLSSHRLSREWLGKDREKWRFATKFRASPGALSAEAHTDLYPSGAAAGRPGPTTDREWRSHDHPSPQATGETER